MPSASASLLASFFLALSLSPAAWAEEYNYGNPIVGERAIGMGGAATAVADDASAAYYNPAGLALNRFVSLSLSATVGELRWQEIEDFLGRDGVSNFSWGLIASSWSWATDLWGGRFALSIFVPDSYDFEMNQQILTDLTMPNGSRMVHAHLIRQHSSDTYLAGPSLAYPIGDKWALGGTVFFSYHTYRILQDDTYRYSTGALTQVVDNESGTTYGLQPRVGVLYQPIPELQIGLCAKLGYLFAAAGNRRRLRIESEDDSGLFSRVNLDEDYGGLKEEDRLNAKVSQGASLGLAWELSDGVLLSLDASLYSPVEYEWFDRTIEKEWTWNVALGGEWRVAESWPLRFGLFTNNSAAPHIHSADLAGIDPLTYSRDELPADRIDFYGLSLSLGHLTPTSTLDVSVQTIFGLGERVEVLETGAGVHDVFDFTVHLTLSGSYIFVDDERDLERQLAREEEAARKSLRQLPSPWEIQREQQLKQQQEDADAKSPPANPWQPQEQMKNQEQEQERKRGGQEPDQNVQEEQREEAAKGAPSKPEPADNSSKEWERVNGSEEE